MPSIARLTVYPVKSCDGVDHTQVELLPNGGLRHDRQFALVDPAGKFINGKRTPLMHQLALSVDPLARDYRVGRRGEPQSLAGNLDRDGKPLSDWLSDFFSLEVSIVENDETGFPDDLDASGPTIVSTATLKTVADWFPGMTVEEVRGRFRANIEIDGVEPFWEDHLFGADSQPKPFRIGSALLGGTNPCQRCVVPTRDPITGTVGPAGFSQQFRKLREQTLPAWAARDRFDHFYRLCTNTRRLDQVPATLHLGDWIELAT
ncbi:MOSC domain-containing protein [Schlesneria paludicola]|uniref:MOSC domain-containing protein n=1 Tax=Schlesneria paludicola TaxID=360056 RepID=UPI00029A5473|nr:MOSC N-terminal beta barrel domain-containing protein [Schlesneria paludicola]